MSPVLSRVATGQGFGSIVSYKRAYLASQGGGAYQISRSLRFNSADSAYLSRTPATAGNRKTWTWAGWVKRSGFGGNRTIFGTDFLGASYCNLYFDGNNTFFLENYSGGYQARLQTTQVFRDPSAWYHIVVAVDTTQATAANRVKIYVNGSEVTAFAIATYPSQNTDLLINNNQYHEISNSSSTYAFNGYLADIHFIDGQALTPSSFTETSLLTGQLIPKTYSGSYGTNGFKLNFSSNASTAALGTDSSGNNNTWAVNNFSVTAGAGNDSLVDTPTSYGTDTGVGAEVRGNYATLNPLDISTGGTVTLSNGNLDWQVVNGNGGIRGTFAVSTGKWYFEFTYNEKPSGGGTAFGVLNVNDALGLVGSTSGGYTYYSEGVSYTKKINNNVQTDYGVSFAPGDVIGVALDLDAGTIAFYKNGASQGQAFSGLSGTFAPACSSGTGTGTARATLNAGQRAFAYTAPSGFKALVDTNLTAPAIVLSNTAFDTKLYTGNGSTQTISGLAFSPDLVWFKQRNTTRENHLYDSVRGVQKALYTDLTNAEATDTDALSSFNSDGWTMGADGGSNQNGGTYVAWTWDAGTSTVTNTAGSITSQVRANASAGFSIVTYTGTGANATVGHGCAAAPALVIIKSRSLAEPWSVYHSATTANGYLLLNATNAYAVNSAFMNNTAPTSTVFSLGSGTYPNSNGATHVAYCFAPVSGYSSFGSYVAGSGEPFVYLGFKPALVMIKAAVGRSTAYTSWYIADNKRPVYNPENLPLWANQSAQEGLRGNGSGAYSSDLNIDLLSNGFKIRDNNGAPDETNFTGATYIYCAWAESPFQYARAR